MIIAGTKHFKANLDATGNQDSEKSIYQALRLYNSGSMNANVSNILFDSYMTMFLINLSRISLMEWGRLITMFLTSQIVSRDLPTRFKFCYVVSYDHGKI
jgi:hypothetical protein